MYTLEHGHPPADSRQPASDALLNVLLISDGRLSDAECLRQLCRRNSAHLRLFAVGVSADTSPCRDRSLGRQQLAAIARCGGGKVEWIGSEAEAAEVAARQLCRAAQPALTDLCIRWGEEPDARIVQSPPQIESVFSGEPLLVFALLGSLSTTSAVLSAVYASGPRAGYRTEWRVHTPQALFTEDRLVHTLAARRLCRGWEEHTLLHEHAAVDHALHELERPCILALALRYHLVSALTSIVAVEDVAQPAEEGAELELVVVEQEAAATTVAAAEKKEKETRSETEKQPTEKNANRNGRLHDRQPTSTGDFLREQLSAHAVDQLGYIHERVSLGKRVPAENSPAPVDLRAVHPHPVDGKKKVSRPSNKAQPRCDVNEAAVGSAEGADLDGLLQQCIEPEVEKPVQAATAVAERCATAIRSHEDVMRRSMVRSVKQAPARRRRGRFSEEQKAVDRPVSRRSHRPFSSGSADGGGADEVQEQQDVECFEYFEESAAASVTDDGERPPAPSMAPRSTVCDEKKPANSDMSVRLRCSTASASASVPTIGFNVESLDVNLPRGVSLDSLLCRSESLEQESAMFHRKARRLDRCMNFLFAPLLFLLSLLSLFGWLWRTLFVSDNTSDPLSASTVSTAKSSFRAVDPNGIVREWSSVEEYSRVHSSNKEYTRPLLS